MSVSEQSERCRSISTPVGSGSPDIWQLLNAMPLRRNTYVSTIAPLKVAAIAKISEEIYFFVLQVYQLPLAAQNAMTLVYFGFSRI
jgi:hypothetical protein